MLYYSPSAHVSILCARYVAGSVRLVHTVKYRADHPSCSPTIPMSPKHVQCVAVDLVEYKTLSEGLRFVTSVIDRYSLSFWFQSKKKKLRLSVALSIVSLRPFGYRKFAFQLKKELDNRLVIELQSVYKYNKTSSVPSEKELCS